jgi:hypothetical protein
LDWIDSVPQNKTDTDTAAATAAADGKEDEEVEKEGERKEEEALYDEEASMKRGAVGVSRADDGANAFAEVKQKKAGDKNADSVDTEVKSEVEAGAATVAVAGEGDRSKMDGTSLSTTSAAKQSIIVAENKESGEVQWSTYVDYVRLMGGAGTGVLLLLLMLLGQGLAIAVNVWLARWAGMSYEDQQKGLGLPVYCGLVGAAVLASIVRSVAVFNVRNYSMCTAIYSSRSCVN